MNRLVFSPDPPFGPNPNRLRFSSLSATSSSLESSSLFKEGDTNNNNFLPLWSDEDVMMVVVAAVVVNDVGCKSSDPNFSSSSWVVGMADAGGDEGGDALEGDDE